MKQLAILLVCLSLGGCLKATNEKPPLNAPSTDASIKLAEAASSVSRSLNELVAIEKATHPEIEKPLVQPTIFDLQTRASVDWAGPITPLLKNIAKTSHYRLEVMGNAPAIPVLINLTVRDKSIGQILRMVDYQAGQKAHIKVYPNRKTIELRYAKV